MMLLLGADVDSLLTPGKCMAVIGSEHHLTARSMLLWIFDKQIALVNSINHITFPSLWLVIKFRSRFFDLWCLPFSNLSDGNGLQLQSGSKSSPNLWLFSYASQSKCFLFKTKTIFRLYIVSWHLARKREKSLSTGTSVSTLVLVASRIEQNIFPHCEGMYFSAKLNVFHLTYMPVTMININKHTKDRVGRLG